MQLHLCCRRSASSHTRQQGSGRQLSDQQLSDQHILLDLLPRQQALRQCHGCIKVKVIPVSVGARLLAARANSQLLAVWLQLPRLPEDWGVGVGEGAGAGVAAVKCRRQIRTLVAPLGALNVVLVQVPRPQLMLAEAVALPRPPCRRLTSSPHAKPWTSVMLSVATGRGKAVDQLVLDMEDHEVPVRAPAGVGQRTMTSARPKR